MLYAISVCSISAGFLFSKINLFCLSVKQDMIHIADTKVARRYGDFFIRQIHKFEEVSRNVSTKSTDLDVFFLKSWNLNCLFPFSVYVWNCLTNINHFVKTLHHSMFLHLTETKPLLSSQLNRTLKKMPNSTGSSSSSNATSR